MVQYHLELSEGHGGPSAMSTHPWSIGRGALLSDLHLLCCVCYRAVPWPEVHQQKPLLQGGVTWKRNCYAKHSWKCSRLGIANCSNHCILFRLSSASSLLCHTVDSPYSMHSNACPRENVSDPSWDQRPSSGSDMDNFHRLVLKVRKVCTHAGWAVYNAYSNRYWEYYYCCSVTIVLACSERTWNLHARLLHTWVWPDVGCSEVGVLRRDRKCHAHFAQGLRS